MSRVATMTLVLLTLACSGGSSSGATTDVRDDTCRPANLADAAALDVVRLPRDCTINTTGTLGAPQRISDDAALGGAVTCPTPPTIDLGSHDLLLAAYSLSPAAAGMEVVDDGQTITFVHRQRPPCPGGARPMPMQVHVAVLAPKNERTFAEASCTLQPRCDD